MCKLCNRDREPLVFNSPKPYKKADAIYENIYPTVTKRTGLKTGNVSYKVTIWLSKKETRCKTFDTENLAISFAKENGATETKSLSNIFSDAVLDYMGERPCRTCCNINMGTYKKHGIDFIIIKKLFNIATKGRRKEVHAESSKVSSKAQIKHSKTISKNITLCLVNGKASYRVIFKMNNNFDSKTFESLEEAIKHRDGIETKKIKKKAGKNIRERIEKTYILYLTQAHNPLDIS